ncbi:hypothetical protein BDF14DRAFT_1879699 [Spinellus fusiger]|nr:hypothetical protein BDF14DRAFT_1879699 [Spinellus fusiger]
MASTLNKSKTKNSAYQGNNLRQTNKKKAKKRNTNPPENQERHTILSNINKSTKEVIYSNDDSAHYDDPDYDRVVEQLDKMKHQKLSRAQLWRDSEKKLVQEWFIAQKQQAWDEYYVSE